MRMKHTFGILLAAGSVAQAQSAFPDHFVGDAGGMLVASQPVVHETPSTHRRQRPSVLRRLHQKINHRLHPGRIAPAR